MRTPLRVLSLFFILSASVPGQAAAEWHIIPFIGLTFNGETTLFDPEGGVESSHWSLGGSVALMGRGPIGVEGLFVYTPGFFQNENPPDSDVPAANITTSRSMALMGNVVLTIPRAWNEYGLRPFLSGGIGLLRVSSTDSLNVFPISENLLGYNLGGGAYGLITERTGLRFELRYFSNLKPTDESNVTFGRVRLNYWMADVGVVFRY